MKKKMIFALLLAGMSFATPSKVEAQETAKIAGGESNKVAAGYQGWHDFYITLGDVSVNIYGCWGAGDGCYVGG